MKSQNCLQLYVKKHYSTEWGTPPHTSERLWMLSGMLILYPIMLAACLTNFETFHMVISLGISQKFPVFLLQLSPLFFWNWVSGINKNGDIIFKSANVYLSLNIFICCLNKKKKQNNKQTDHFWEENREIKAVLFLLVLLASSIEMEHEALHLTFCEKELSWKARLYIWKQNGTTGTSGWVL